MMTRDEFMLTAMARIQLPFSTPARVAQKTKYLAAALWTYVQRVDRDESHEKAEFIAMCVLHKSGGAAGNFALQDDGINEELRRRINLAEACWVELRKLD